MRPSATLRAFCRRCLAAFRRVRWTQGPSGKRARRAWRSCSRCSRSCRQVIRLPRSPPTCKRCGMRRTPYWWRQTGRSCVFLPLQTRPAPHSTRRPRCYAGRRAAGNPARLRAGQRGRPGYRWSRAPPWRTAPCCDNSWCRSAAWRLTRAAPRSTIISTADTILDAFQARRHRRRAGDRGDPDWRITAPA